MASRSCSSVGTTTAGRHHTHFLVAAGSGTGEPTSWEVDDDGHGWGDIGVLGPGPDVLRIPESAVAGHHRICLESRSSPVCAALDIAD